MPQNTTVDNLVLQYMTRGESSFRNSLRGTGGAVGGLENQINRLGLVQQAVIAGGGYKLIQYVKELGGASLKASGDMKVTEKALEKMLKNPAAGKKLFGDILDMGKKDPLPIADMDKMSKQLIAMRFRGDEVVPVMKAIGSAVSVLGNDDGKFERIVYNLGQVRTQGKAYMRDIRQFNMAGLDVIGIMKDATGKDFTDKQLTEMDGKDFIRDFTKGLNIQFGGMLDLVGNELPGRLIKLDNSFILLKKSIGDVFSSDATAFVGGLTSITDKTAELITEFPTLSKIIAGTLGTAGVATGGVFLLGSLAGAYKNLTSVIGGTSKAKSLLATATKSDTLAESAKAIVAGREGKAIGNVGVMAERAAKSKLGLARATATAGSYAEEFESKVQMQVAGGVSRANAEKAVAQSMARYGMLPEVAETAGAASIWTKAGRLVGGAGRSVTGKVAGIQSYLSEPALGEAATGMRSVLPQAANRYEFLGMGHYRDTLTGQFAKRGAALEYNAAYGAEAQAAGGLRGALGGISNGQLLGGAALGATAGVQSFDNWKHAGVTTGEAAALATTTGVAAGLVSMFVPGGAIAVAAGEGMSWALNKAVNEPMEKAAQGSMSDKEMAAASKMSPAQLAQFYFQKRDEALARGDSTEAQSYLYNANQQQRKAKTQAQQQADAAADAKRAADDRSNAIYNTINNGAAFYGGASQSRNGAWTITIPQSPADKSHRTLKFNNNTPTPAYL